MVPSFVMCLNISKQNFMKHSLLLACLIASSLFAVAQMDDAKFLYQTNSLATAAIEKVTAETSGGNIIAMGADKDLRIEVYVKPSNSREKNLSKEDIKKRLEADYDLIVKTDNHLLTAIAKTKRKNFDWNRGLSISFKIYLPKKCSNHLVTSGGNISITALTGDQNFTTSGGNLDVESLSGHIIGTTSGGNIAVLNSTNDIELTTSGGNIEARDCKGNIKLTTSGGNLTLRSLDGTVNAITSGGTVFGIKLDGSITAQTSGGNVLLKELKCSLDAATSGGNMDIQIKKLTGKLNLTNSSGNINLEIPGNQGMDLKFYAEKIHVSNLVNFSGTTDKTKMIGSLNGGGIPVTVHGNGGKIELRLK
jgi:hypothetical protein